MTKVAAAMEGMKGGRETYLNLTCSDSSMKDTPQLN